MICFCYFCKKNYLFILGVAHGKPIFAQVGPKNGNFQGFQQFFFRTTGFQLKLLILIEFPNIIHRQSTKKKKVGVVFGAKFGPDQAQCCDKSIETSIINRFLSYFIGEYLLKLKAVVVHTPEWKAEANIAKNATFEGHLESNFAQLGSKMAKN